MRKPGITGGMMIVFALVLSLVSAQDDQKKRDINRLLKTKKLEKLEFADTPLEEVVEYLRNQSGLNLTISPKIWDKKPRDQYRITFKVESITLKSAMKMILAMHDLAARYREGVMEIVLRDELKREVVTRVYDVQDLMIKINNFPGPKIDIKPPSVGNLSGAASREAGGNLVTTKFTLDEPDPQDGLSEEFIMDHIRNNTGTPSDWEGNERVSAQIATGTLVVAQTPLVHKEIRQLIDMLRQMR